MCVKFWAITRSTLFVLGNFVSIGKFICICGFSGFGWNILFSCLFYVIIIGFYHGFLCCWLIMLSYLLLNATVAIFSSAISSNEYVPVLFFFSLQCNQVSSATNSSFSKPDHFFVWAPLVQYHFLCQISIFVSIFFQLQPAAEMILFCCQSPILNYSCIFSRSFSGYLRDHWSFFIGIKAIWRQIIV